MSNVVNTDIHFWSIMEHCLSCGKMFVHDLDMILHILLSLKSACGTKVVAIDSETTQVFLAAEKNPVVLGTLQ